MNTVKIATTVCCLSMFLSCELGDVQDYADKVDNSELPMNEMQFNPSFKWNNTQETQVTLSTKDNKDNAIANVRVSVWSDYEEDGGIEIINGATNQNGQFVTSHKFEADTKEVVLKTNYIGFVSEYKVPIVNGQINHTFGGIKESHSGKSVNSKSLHNQISNTLKSTFSSNININYLGTFNNQGVPDYLEPDRDFISADFLNGVNAALPEQRPVPTYHPEYLETGNVHNLVVTDEAEVWVTFVAEGAGYRNVLAYYTYDRDFPPETPADITDCYVIFPNTSFAGSGGGLYSGDKVSLGIFQENTVIGWILMRNGWDTSSRTPTEGAGLLYSNLELNPEPNIEHRQHCVLLYEEDEDVFLIAFEDLIRPGGDNDFNDAIFYASANPIENIQIENIVIANPDPTDSDFDGVSDSFDDYPDDPSLAFNNFYPGKNLFGSLAFEDNWPSRGDFDFNDLVVDYNFNRITNANNEVVSLEGKFIVRANGASFDNGFGFTLEGIASSSIQSVTGSQLTESYIQTNANGTEAGQSNATIIVFDNAWEHGYGNTRVEQPFIQPDTLSVTINLVTPIDENNFGAAPFNAFMIINKERGKEVHLGDYPPSDLADTSYFGQSSDDTQTSIGKYYKSQNNLPWALNFPSKFNYPIELTSIENSHLNFVQWALSGGQSFRNWYKDEEGYRDGDNIYSE
ncbi:MAG: LruC domain-containing protein [Jejuia sp.]